MSSSPTGVKRSHAQMQAGDTPSSKSVITPSRTPILTPSRPPTTLAMRTASMSRNLLQIKAKLQEEQRMEELKLDLSDEHVKEVERSAEAVNLVEIGDAGSEVEFAGELGFTSEWTAKLKSGPSKPPVTDGQFKKLIEYLRDFDPNEITDKLVEMYTPAVFKKVLSLDDAVASKVSMWLQLKLRKSNTTKYVSRVALSKELQDQHKRIKDLLDLDDSPKCIEPNSLLDDVVQCFAFMESHIFHRQDWIPFLRKKMPNISAIRAFDSAIQVLEVNEHSTFKQLTAAIIAAITPETPLDHYYMTFGDLCRPREFKKGKKEPETMIDFFHRVGAYQQALGMSDTATIYAYSRNLPLPYQQSINRSKSQFPNGSFEDVIGAHIGEMGQLAWKQGYKNIVSKEPSVPSVAKRFRNNKWCANCKTKTHNTNDCRHKKFQSGMSTSESGIASKVPLVNKNVAPTSQYRSSKEPPKKKFRRDETRGVKVNTISVEQDTDGDSCSEEVYDDLRNIDQHDDYDPYGSQRQVEYEEKDYDEDPQIEVNAIGVTSEKSEDPMVQDNIEEYVDLEKEEPEP